MRKECKKKEHEECVKCNVQRKSAEEAAKARKKPEEVTAVHVTEYKICMKVKVPMGEPIRAYHLSLEFGSDIEVMACEGLGEWCQASSFFNLNLILILIYLDF